LFSPSNVDVAPAVFAHLGLSPLPDLDWDGVAVGLKGVSTGSLTAARDARLIKFAPEDGFLLKGERLRLANAESGTTIRYTLDGTLPTIASESGDSIEMERSGLLRARAFGPQGAVGPSSSIFVTVQEAPLRALPDRPTSPGLRFALVRGAVEDVRVADFGSPDRRGVIAAPTADLGERGPFAARFVGFVKIETPGVYRFGVAGTGDSALKVGGRTGFGLVSLEAGLHEFELTTVQPRGEGTLVLTISARGQRPREAMDSLFAH
jgi:hypothetical protein